MCNCINELTSKLLEKVKEDAKEKEWTILDYPTPGLENVTFFLGKKDGTIQVEPTQLTTEFTFSYTFKKKDKTQSSHRNGKIRMAFTYCPFCGQPYKKEVGKQAVANE